MIIVQSCRATAAIWRPYYDGAADNVSVYLFNFSASSLLFPFKIHNTAVAVPKTRMNNIIKKLKKTVQENVYRMNL